MSYLLDTNVVSETIRRRQNKLVIGWLEQVPAEALVLTLGEIRKGVEKLKEWKGGKNCARSWSTNFQHGLRGECFRSILTWPTTGADCFAKVGRPFDR